MKKVLYLSYDGMTDPLGQGQVLSYLVGLAAQGHQITIISFEKPGRFLQGREQIAAICSKAGIEWAPQTYTRHPPVLSTIYDLQKMISKGIKLHRRQPFDIVHCRGYIPALAGLKLKRKFGLRFIFDMRGFWIDEKSEGEGGWNPSSPVYGRVIKYLRKKERQFYLESDVIITLTHAAARLIAREFPELAHKITVIPTCVNLELFQPFDRQVRAAIRAKLGIPADAFVLLYSGGTGPNYDISFLLKAWQHLRSLNADTWLLVLSKDGINGLEAAGATNLDQVVLVSIPYTEVGSHLMAGDLGVVNYATGLSVAGRSPTKLGEYWASGLPALAPAGIGDVDELFERYDHSGLTISQYDFSKLRTDSFAVVKKEQLREYASAYFGLSQGTAAYHAVYQGLN